MPKDPVENMPAEKRDVTVDTANATAVAPAPVAPAPVAPAPAPPKKEDGKPKPDPHTYYRTDVPKEMRGNRTHSADHTVPGGMIVKRELNKLVVVNSDGKELPGHRPYISDQKTIEVEKA